MHQPEQPWAIGRQDGRLIIRADGADRLGHRVPVGRFQIGILLQGESREVGRPGEQQRIGLLGFVLMPDHCHIVLAPRTPFSLKQVLHSLFSFSAQAINKRLHRQGALWMEEYFERHLRDQEETRQCLAYLHLNPVRKGLVQKAEDWPYSSAHPPLHKKMNWAWYVGMEKE